MIWASRGALLALRRLCGILRKEDSNKESTSQRIRQRPESVALFGTFFTNQGSHDFFSWRSDRFHPANPSDLLAIGWDLDHWHGIGIKKLCLNFLTFPVPVMPLPTSKHLKEVLVGNTNHGPCFLGELETLFSFNRLVESSLANGSFPSSAPSSGLVRQSPVALRHWGGWPVLILNKFLLACRARAYMADQITVLGIIEVGNGWRASAWAPFESTKLVSFFIKLFPFFEGLDQGINNPLKVGLNPRRTRNNQGVWALSRSTESISSTMA